MPTPDCGHSSIPARSHGRRLARARGRRVTVGCHQRGRRKADRVPVYGRRCHRPGHWVARAARGTCRTRNLPLVGAPANPVATLRSQADLPGSPCVARYGAEAPNVIATASCERPTQQVADGIDVTRAEFEYTVTHEGALTVDDILTAAPVSAWSPPTAPARPARPRNSSPASVSARRYSMCDSADAPNWPPSSRFR